MADDTPSQSPSSGRGGGDNWLTRRHGPLPTWAWIAIPVGAAGVYLIYKKMKGSSTTSTTATATPTSSGGWSGGYSGGTAQTGSSTTSPSVGPLTGSGYGPATPSQVVSSGGQNYAWIASPASLGSLLQAGNVYVQSEPGAFTPVTSASITELAGGTPLWYSTPYTSLGSSGGGGGYGNSSQDRLAPLNAQLASRPYRGGSGGGSGAGAAAASAVPAVVNPPARSAPVQPNVTWSGLNTNVEKGESTI